MKVKGLRWWIIGLIGVATIINYIDRSAINIMWPFIYKEFGIADEDNKQALALITNIFLVAYAIGQTVTGKMMDAIGTRLGMVISIVGWSISIGLHSIARSLASFSIFRAMLGVSEAGNWPGATKSNAEWFPARERAIAQGIFGASASMGSVIALPVIAWSYAMTGWQMTFLFIAFLGILWIIPWLFINKNTPDKHPWITKEEQEHILDTENKKTATTEVKVYTWKQLLNFKNTWGIISSRFFIDPIWWMFVTWLPTFLKEQFAFDIKQVGAFGWVPYMFAAIGGITGGLYSSSLVRKGMSPAKARKNAITIGCVIMLLSLGSIAFYLNELKEHVNIAIALISAALFGFQFLINNLQTLPADYFNGKNVGTVSGMGGTAAVAGTIILTFMVPILTKTSYTTLFVLAALMVPISWLCITFITSKRKIANTNSI
ncbi:MFS transporter [Chitinophagaceae bacterium IBVUCB2]|nr:MFS transporter [Chitinophagaceae bacterium IBVUCB2]